MGGKKEMNKKLIGIFVCMLLLATMIATTIAKDTDNIPLAQNDDSSYYYQPGDFIERYNLLNTKKVDPLFEKKQTYLQVSFENDIVELIEQIDEAMVYSYIVNLTSFGPRLTTTEACKEAGTYLYSEFKDMGLDVRYDNWSLAPNYNGSNIEATLPGSDHESDCIFIICAHYDSVYNSPGADDNAAGCAAVLAAANIMRHYSFNHTVRFVLFSGEEQGTIGSYFYAEEAYRNYDHIIGVLNADAISYATNEINASKMMVFQNEESGWLSNYTKNIAQIYLEYINLEVFPLKFITASSDIHRFYQFGYDGLWYIEYENNPYFFNPNDVVENFNMTYAKRNTRLMLATLANLAQSYQEKPPIDVPTWKVGDEWTYHTDFYFDFGIWDKRMLYGTSNHLVYTVVKDTGDDYVLNFKGPFQGGIEASLVPMASMRITKLSRVTGSLIVQKSNLAIKEYSIKINGISYPMIGKIPILLPIPAKMVTNITFSPAFCTLPFPVYDGKYGNLPDFMMNLSIDVNLLFKIPLSPQINEWEGVPYMATNFPYRCEKELVTVAAGTYDTYKVSTGFWEVQVDNNYAPEVGNMVKQRIWIVTWAFPTEPGLEIKQELISTTYTPES